MDPKGWIKLHRQFLTWEWHDDPNMVTLFVHLLLLANHQDGRWQGHEVRRGQVITGRNKLAKTLGISPKSVRTCLNRLKSTSEVAIKTANKFSIITICNYESYQSANDEKGQQNGQRKGQQRASKGPAKGHKQEGEECKKEDIAPAVSGGNGTPSAEPASDFSRLCRAFTDAFEARFGTKYLFQGARDGKAARELLATGASVDQIMATLQKAWAKTDGYWGPKISSLGFLFAKWNEISAEGNAGRKIEPPSKPFTLDPEPQKSEAQINAEIMARMEKTFAGMKIERRK